MYKSLITISLLVCCCTSLLAQKAETPSAHGADYSLSFEPIFGLNNCFKTNLEYKSLRGNFGIEITPELYSGQHLLNHANDDITGFGIGIYQKYYVPGDDKTPVMLSYGLTYRSVNVNYSDEGFISYQQNGLDYYQYKNFNDVLNNKSLLVGLTAQVRIVNIDHFFMIDTYAGAGYKFTKQQSTYPGFRNYNAQMYDYGYKGITFLVGLKMGFHLQSK